VGPDMEDAYTLHATVPHEVDLESGTLVLTNEFASVTVVLDSRGNGPRLRIVNRHNGRAVHLDPLELASLTWLTHASLGPFLDPSQTGWGCNQGAQDDLDI